MKKVALLSLLLVASILMPNQARSFTTDIKHLFKNNAGLTAITVVGSSLLTCCFFHEAVKEWARHPDTQDISSSYARNQFIKGTTWASLGTVGALFTIGIANQNQKVNRFFVAFIESFSNLEFSKGT